MHSIFQKIYFLVFGPLVKRLQHEMNLQVINVIEAERIHNENVSKRILPELLRLGYEIDGGNCFYGDQASLFSAEKIAEVVSQLERNPDIVALCAKHDISLSAALQMQSKFAGMNKKGIEQIRLLEQQCNDLSEQVIRLRAEVSQLTLNTTATAENMSP